MDISPDALGFRFQISEVDDTRYTDGNSGYTITFLITNTESKARLITVARASYVTNAGLQLELDKWLNGALLESGRIQGNAQRKCGLIFHKNNLTNISQKDSLHIVVGVPDRSKKLALRFEVLKDSGTQEIVWVLTEIQTEECDETVSTDKVLRKKIERLEAFEERAGVRIEGLCVTVGTDSSYFTINGELYPRNGIKLAANVKLVFTVYDKDGGVLGTTQCSFYNDSFYGFEPFSETFDIDVTKEPKIAKIRVYPTIS